MRSTTADAWLRACARVVYYLAILVAVAVVASLTGRVDVAFVYQGF